MPSAKIEALRALTIVAEGQFPDTAEPLKGLGSGVFELALKVGENTFRFVYALQTGDDIWVLHSFQKKSKSGIQTPKFEIDLITERLKKVLK